MTRLTRTQKYANLRNQLSSDKEEKIVSQDLSTFQNRLNNVEDTLSPTQELFSNLEKKVEEQTKTETNPNYIWNPFPDDIINQPEKEIWEPVAELNEEDKYIQPVLEQKKLEEEKAKESIFDKLANFASAAEEKPEIQDVPAFEQPAFVGDTSELKKESSYFDSFVGEPSDTNNNADDFNAYFEPNSEQDSKQSIEEIYANVFADVKDESGEFVTIKERDTYLNQTISDVNSYNINNGLKTIDQLVDNSVDAVRHPEDVLEEAETIEIVEEENTNNSISDINEYDALEKKSNIEEVLPYENVIEETPVEEQPINNAFDLNNNVTQELDADKIEEPVIEDDEEFSNTVSMEISKIMEEISSEPIKESVTETIAEPLNSEELSDLSQDTIAIDETITEETAEDVVEIKNISEMDAEPVRDTMSSTIPFVVAADDEEEEFEEDEEGGSNTVLNVILIVLIVVLVAVLGLIVFYILKTKGIF